MSSQPSPLPFSLRKHLAVVGHLDDLPDEAQEDLAAILVAVDDSPLWHSSSIDPTILLLECMWTAGDSLAQWEHEITVDAELRHRVREALPRHLVEIHAEMQSRLDRNQSPPW